MKTSADTHIRKRRRVGNATIRSYAALGKLSMRPMGGGVLEVLSITDGSVTRIGEIACDGPQEKLVRELIAQSSAARGDQS